MATASPASRRADDSTLGTGLIGTGLFGTGLIRTGLIGTGLFGVALIGGLVLRFVAPSPMWLDEALTVHIASLGPGDMVEALRHDGHPGLYYLLLGGWMDVFGDSNAAARSLSGLFSAATVPVIWAIGRRRSAELGAAAAVLALATPYLLRYGTEARMYALVVFLVAAGWLAVERAVDQPTVGRLVVVAAIAAAMVHTNYWTFWAIGAALVLLVLRVVTSDPSVRPQNQAIAVRLIAAIAVGSATFLAWAGVFFDQLASTGTPWADRARPAEIAIESMQAIGGNNRFEGELLGLLFVVAALIGTFGVARRDALELRFGRGPLTVAAIAATVTLGLGGLVAMATGSGFEGRYAAVIVPFVIVLAAQGITRLPRRLAIGAMAVLVLFGLAVGVDEARRDRTQAGDVAAAIIAEAEPGDVVGFCPDQVGPATIRALELAGMTTTTFAYPRGDGRFVDWADYADTIAASPPEVFVDGLRAAADTRPLWVVTGLGYNALGDRCESVLGLLNFTHSTTTVIASSTVFEPMMLTRHEPLP